MSIGLQVLIHSMSSESRDVTSLEDVKRAWDSMTQEEQAQILQTYLRSIITAQGDYPGQVARIHNN